MKRIFIALKIDPSPSFLQIISYIRSVTEDEKIKWVDPSNIHLTLAFLGETEEERITIAGILLKKICSSSNEFRFILKGTGVFKNYREPRVIWIGTGESEKLVSLSCRINEGLTDTGFRLEERAFSPHITLGRIKLLRDPARLKTAMEKYREEIIQEVRVKEVILFESILKPKGPFYRAIGNFRLKQTDPVSE